MNRLTKRIFSLCMVALMLAMLIPQAAFAAPEVDPSFSVEYHAWVTDYATKGSSDDTFSTDVINTDKSGEGAGGVLPTNKKAQNNTLPTKKIYFDENGIKTKVVLSEIFKSRNDFTYYNAPGLHYIDQVTHFNGNYLLRDIWVGESADGPWTVWTTGNSPSNTGWTASTTFTKISDLSTVKFSNDPAAADTATRLVLREDAVIRLVYNTIMDDHDFSTKVFDYDISDGDLKDNILNTHKQGINSHGTTLGFGNANTNSGLDSNTLSDGTALNKAAKTGSGPSYQQGAYGITQKVGLTADGLPKFSVSAPDLFSDKEITGKTVIPGNHTLTFVNHGDLYEINKISIADKDGTPAVSDNLGNLRHPHSDYTHIWTNNFFPLDDLSYIPGNDPEFGKSTWYCVYPDSDGKKTMPGSDDKTYDHNCYFGLTYDVNFTLDADYIGPMNYLFFGDDDLWLYLIKDGDYANAQLVCDIGGVHSAIGEYVDLWDYIEGGREDHDTAEYTLRFFYTERGASGSTFYMSFVLPQVHPITPIDERGSLKVEKNVEDIVTDQLFDFQINLSGNEKLAREVYSAAVYETASSQPKYVIFAGNETLNVQLKDGGYVLIDNLPVDASYTVTETPVDDYATSASGASGTIETDVTKEAIFTNRYKRGSLEVSKTVTGDMAEAGKKFDFTVTLSDTSINGTYGGMTFTNGVATFSLAHGESLKATGLPAAINYAVTEASYKLYDTSSTNASGTIVDQATATAAFINHFNAGKLTITKTVTGSMGDTTKKFPFTVTLSDTSINGVYGDLTFINGVASFSLAHGQSITASNLPKGISYVVSETDSGKYAVSSTGASGTIVDNQTATSDFTNHYNAGNLTISKIVTGEKGDKTKAFDFTLTLSDTTINGEFGDVTFVNGVATFSLAHDQSVTVTGLPKDVEYVVTEANDNAYTTTSTGASGTIVDNQTLAAVFTNDFKEGTLIVSKTVSGEEADRQQKFPFTVTLSDSAVSGVYGDLTFINGAAIFSLADGDSVTASGLPADLSYTVKETEYGNYFPSVNGEKGDEFSGVIDNDGTDTVDYNNHYASDAVVYLTALKTVDGAVPGDFIFNFHLIDEEGNILQTVQNDNDGVITFEPLSYRTEGTYFYGIFEEDTNDAAMDCDATIYVVGVNVILVDGGNYEAEVAVLSVKDEEQALHEGTILFQNETVELTELTVNKVWAGDAGKHQPDSVLVQLYCNGEAYGEPVELNAENKWTHTWIELRAEGNEWTVDEIEVPDNYHKTVAYDQEQDLWTITNEYVPDTGDHTPVALLTVAAALALAGICALVVMRRKNAR